VIGVRLGEARIAADLLGRAICDLA